MITVNYDLVSFSSRSQTDEIRSTILRKESSLLTSNSSTWSNSYTHATWQMEISFCFLYSLIQRVALGKRLGKKLIQEKVRGGKISEIDICLVARLDYIIDIELLCPNNRLDCSYKSSNLFFSPTFKVILFVQNVFS